MASKICTLPSGKVFLQVLGCGIEDATPCIFLFTDSKRYMFNCGEGTQRMFTENKVKLGKLNTIFFTQNKWFHLGGFLGMSMTLRDIGKETIGIHGPPGLNQVIHGARSFLHKENVNFKVTEYTSKHLEAFHDDEVVIQPILINQDTGSQLRNSVNDWLNHVSFENQDTKLIKEYSVNHLEQNRIICYAAKLKDYPGKLLPKVAMSLGVPKGPMFRMLKDGQTVTLPNGKKVSPEEVTEPPIPGPSFLIIDCPTRKYISSIVKHKAFKKYQKDGTEQATLVIHMTQQSLTDEAPYKDWMARFHEDTHHCILDKKELSKCPSVFRAQYSVQYKLNQVHSEIFPVIERWRNKAQEEFAVKKKKYEGFNRKFLCENLMKFNLRPRSQIGPDDSEVLKEIEVGTIVDEALKILKGFEESDALRNDKKKEHLKGNKTDCENGIFREAESKDKEITDEEIDFRTERVEESSVEHIGEKRKRIGNEINGNDSFLSSKICKCDDGLHNDTICHGEEREDSLRCTCPSQDKTANDKKYPKIVFLGTGSSIPSKYRNVSSILVHSSQQSTILLDCGEGTYGQIVNHYGNEAEDIIRRLNFIFITHMHADHHLGVIRILKIHRRIFKKSNEKYIPPLIAGPYKFCKWLQEYAETCERLDFKFADCKIFSEEDSGSSLAEIIPQLSKVTFAPVDHNTEAYGIALVHKDGWKITYSGDTKPCESLVTVGKDSTVLIHEATFEDGMEDEAREKHHSTFGQAMEIAQKMNAKNVLLTHFSQRYAKLPAMKNQTPVGIAFDHMEVHPDEVPVICDLLPKLQVLFPDEEIVK